MAQKKKELDRDGKIRQELSRLKKLYREMPKNKLTLVTPLLENAAFMRVTLDELQEKIKEEGCTEEYRNGQNQKGMKASASLQAYNATIKNYGIVMDKLDKMLPAEAEKNPFADLMVGDDD